MAYRTYEWVKSRGGYVARDLLNPAEKANKYSEELRTGVMLTSTFDPKINMRTGNVQALSRDDIIYRKGYLASRRDSAKAFMAKHPKYKSKTKKR